MIVEVAGSIKQLAEHSDAVVSFFESNALFGVSDLETFGKKQFGIALSSELGSKKYKPPSLRLFSKLIRSPPPSTTAVEVTVPTAVNEPDNVSCGALEVLAKELAVDHLRSILDVLSHHILQNKVDGAQFVAEMNGDQSDFDSFFNAKICGAESAAECDKFKEFKEWMTGDQLMSGLNEAEFGQFVANRYTAFIAHLFVVDQVDGRRLMDEGFKRIANGICDRHGMAKGPMTKLCRAMEDRVKNGKVTELKETVVTVPAAVDENGLCHVAGRFIYKSLSLELSSKVFEQTISCSLRS